MAVDIRDITLRQLTEAVQRQGAPSSLRAGNWDTATGTPTSQYLYGVGGLFGTLGLEQDVISTRVAPRGLLSRLPARNTNVIWPEFAYLVGFTSAEDGADETFDDQGVCDDGPVAGQLLGCTQTAQFGMLTYDTEAIDIGMVGQQVNRGQFQDLRLIGNALDPLANMTPSTTIQNQRVLLQSDALSKMVAVGVAYQNKLLKLTYTGTPANNNTGGAYKEFWGLDNLIVHDHRDAHSQALCPTLDSIIVDYQNADIGADGDAALAFVNSVVWTYRMVQYRAERSGLLPATWVFTMRQAAFWEAASVWACAYYTYRCLSPSTDTNLSSTTVNQIDPRDTIALRDDMRQNRYLLIDGEKVPVVIDDGIVETTNGSGCYKSNMYLVPLTVNGNLAATYIDFYDYSNAIQAAREFNFTANEFWTDGGRFLWMRKVPRKRCIQLASEVQLRIVLRTPHLAAKILNIGYCPTMHEPDALPGDLNYVAPGGVSGTSGYGPSLFDNAGNPIVP